MEQLKKLRPGTIVSVWNEFRSSRFQAVIQDSPPDFPTLYMVRYRWLPYWVPQPPCTQSFVEAKNVRPANYYELGT
jgi:hypothetical protein